MQRYLWQQADGKRHVYDTNDQYPARVGQPLTVLCGDTVTVRVKDMQPGMWLDPTCRACAVELASVLGWSEDEIAQMVARWDEATKRSPPPSPAAAPTTVLEGPRAVHDATGGTSGPPPHPSPEVPCPCRAGDPRRLSAPTPSPRNP